MKTRPFTFVFAVAAASMLLISCSEQPPDPAASAPAPAPVDHGAVTAEIQQMEDAYASAAVARDVDGILPYYADDVVSYSSYKEPVRGKGALRQRLEEQMGKDTLGTTPTFKVEEVFVGGDYVTEIGSWSDADSTGTVKDHGTYFSVFKKNGEKWECIRDISVSAKPKEEAVAMQ
jgi:ketosteroid isomerase-like protein